MKLLNYERNTELNDLRKIICLPKVAAIILKSLSSTFCGLSRKTESFHPVYYFPLAWTITHRDSHWVNEQTQMQCTKRLHAICTLRYSIVKFSKDNRDFHFCGHEKIKTLKIKPHALRQILENLAT